MEKKKIKLIDLVNLNVNLRTEPNEFKEWADTDKLNFLASAVSKGETEKVTPIIVSGGTVVDGRQVINTLRQYVFNDIGYKHSNVPPYSSLDKFQKEYVDNIEFDFIEVEDNKGTAADLFKRLNSFD